MMYDNDEDEYLDIGKESSRKISVAEETHRTSKPSKTSKSPKKSKKKKTTKQKVLMWVGRVSAVLVVTVAILLVFIYGVMAVLCFGPSKTAKKQFVMSVQETSAIGFLANWFCSEEEIAQIKAENSTTDTTEVTDTSLITMDAAQNEDIPDIQIIDVKGSTYKGKLMIVKDPSRLIVGTVAAFQGQGQVVADIAKRYDAVGGVNGGEFVDGDTTLTGVPIGLVMVNGEVVNGANDGVCHVTGITHDNKLILGNMNAQQAKENNIRDCVSISGGIGPFLVINGEPQSVSGMSLNPRTAVGQAADGSILLLAIDGRMANSLGASFSDLQDIMLQYGAVNASTMDGGTSTQMYYEGEVINTPYSPLGPRSCPTAFLIK